jgi:hypothetical protein
MSVSPAVLQARLETLEYLVAIAKSSGDAAAIAVLQAQVGVLQGQVATINTALVEVEADITALDGEVATNTSDIATNAAATAVNTTAIAGNTAAIAGNSAAIAGNTANITTNTSNIATNTSAIAELEVDVAALEAVITSNFFVFVYPIDGTTDDWPSLIATMNANAYKKIIVMLPGPAGQQFQCKSTQNIPSGTTVWATPGTIVNSTLPAGGLSILNCPFFIGPSPVASTQRAIFGNNVPGADTITLVGHFVSAGQTINLTNVNGFFGAQYVVLTATPSGANTIVKVDRSILYTFRQSNGDFYLVNATTSQFPSGRGQDVRVFGNGMKIQGTGYAPFELFGAYRCFIKDVEIRGTFNAGVVMDNALWCVLEDLFTTNSAIPGSGVSYGFFLEGEKNTAHRCTAVDYADGGAFGFGFQSGVLASIVDCKTYNCNNGVSFSSEGATVDQYSVGFGNQVIGGSFSGGSTGIAVSRGNRASKIVGAACNFNSNSGIWLHGPSGSDPAVSATFISAVDCSKNSTGFILDPLVKGTIIQGMDCTDCGIGLDWEDELTFSGLIVNSTLGTSGPVINFNDSKPSAAPSGELTGFRITCSTPGTVAIQGGSAGTTAARLKVTDGTIRPAVGGQGFFMGGANVVVSIADVTIDGAAGGVSGISGQNNVVYRIGSNVNASNCASPFNTTSCVFNRGTFTATGATPVTIPFADANTLDWCDVRAIAGTPAAAPIVAFVPGTGYSSTSAAGDTNTYAYYIGG